MGTTVQEWAEQLPRNVGETERWASGIGGALLALYGLRRGDAAGAMIALAGGALVARGATGYCPVYHTMGAGTADEAPTRGLARVRGRPVQQHGPSAVLDASESERIVETITIGVPASDLYAFWRDFQNLPHVMEYIESVEVLDERRSCWRAKAAGDTTVEWVSEIIRDEPNRFISWKTADDAPVQHAGSVTFFALPGGRGTEVRVEIDYDPPGGRLTRLLAALTGRDPAKQVAEEMRRFKAMAEGGKL